MGQQYQRTKNSLRNSFVAVGLQLVAMLIGFWSRRVFLNYLGPDILGLNTTASSLLGFLNLAELGIGSAIAVTLFKPIFDNNKEQVREIVALQGWLYRRVALVVTGGAAVMMCFFPKIFGSSGLPLWCAYASFGVILYSSLLGYFVNYKQIALDAYQQNYKIQLSTKVVPILKLAAQIYAVKRFENGFVWWLALEAASTTICALILSRTVEHNLPFLGEKVERAGALREKYPEVVTKVKQLFVHRIAGFVSAKAVPLVIYAFASLTLVAKYGNYLIFTENLNSILGACFMGLGASIGNLVAENDKGLSLKVFREIYSIRFLMTAVCCLCLWFLVDPFVKLWIGEEFVLGKTTLFLIIAIFYIANSRSAVDLYLNAYGLFRDIWAPLVEAALSLVLAIILGKFHGLDGILSGVLISQLLIVKVWKPIFLFRCGLKENILFYLKLTGKHLLAGAATFALFDRALAFLRPDMSESFAVFFLCAVPLFLGITLVMFALLYALESGMRGAVRRILATRNS